MLQIFNITAPIFFIIGLGYGAVRFGVFRFEELRGTAKFVMKVGLPALVFFAIAAKPVNEVFDAVYLAGYAAATLAAFFIGWLFGRLSGGDSQLAALSGFSMSFSNTGFIGYPLLSMVIGDAAGGDGGRLKNLTAVLKNLLKNPIILAQFAAVPFAFGWLPLPAALLKTAGVLSAGSGPVALFVIGGSLVGLRLGGRLADIFLLTAGKLLLFPLLVVGLLLLFGAPRDMLFAGALLACVPMASMVAIIHAQYGHEQRGAAIMLLTTVLSFASISLVLLFGR